MMIRRGRLDSATVAIDSNALTALVDASQLDYDPAEDRTMLADERVAMMRIYVYSDCSPWIPPRVSDECDEIRRSKPAAFRDHLLAIVVQCLEGGIEDDDPRIQSRADELGLHHSGEGDCRILAESEARGCDVLLTIDRGFRSHLTAKTRLEILRPSEFWEMLALPPESPPLRQRIAPDGQLLRRWWEMPR